MATPENKYVKFHPAVVCEDIRMESNGKFLIIGVYASEILVNQFPANLNIAFWLPVETLAVGKLKMQFRVAGVNEAILGTANAEADMAAVGRAAFPIPPMTIQIQSPSNIELQVKQGDFDWEVVVSVPVKRNPASV